MPKTFVRSVFPGRECVARNLPTSLSGYLMRAADEVLALRST